MTDPIPPTPEKPEQPAALTARAKKTYAVGRRDHLWDAFLEAYERTENQTLSCKEVGVSHDTVARWKKKPEFMKLFTAAHLRAQKKNNDNLKGSALQRAINGNPHYLIRAGEIVRDERGNPVVAYRDFETQLTMFMLKNRMPDEFRDKFEHEISGQILLSLTSEFAAILRKHVPGELMPAIQKELETLSAKLMGS